MGIILNFSDKHLKKFKNISNKETREEIKSQRGAARRTAAWSAVAGMTAGFSTLSNRLAVGRWGHVLFGWSTAGIIYLGSDAALSVLETGYNTAKYQRKIRRVISFLKTIKKDDVDIYSAYDVSSKAEVKEILNKKIGRGFVFKEQYQKILRQVYNDFADDSRYDVIREVLKENGVLEKDIKKIKKNVKRNGLVLASTVKRIAARNKHAVANVLENVACDDLADRIVDINKNFVGKFRSESHLKGCLTLTSEQQTQSRVKLTEEQKYVRTGGNTGDIMSKKAFIEWLKQNNELVKNGNFEELERRQNKIIDELKTTRSPKEIKSINAMIKSGNFDGLKKSVKKAAKLTEEHLVTDWKRNLFPLTKAFGTPIKHFINKAQDKLYYHGDLYKAHKVIGRLEKKTKLKHADVYCENGTGFRKIRKDYKKAGVVDFIVEHNNKKADAVPNSFVCGYFKDVKNGTDDYFKRTKKAVIASCKQITNSEAFSKTVTGKNGKDYVATRYLDYPVVISVNGQNFEGKKELPLATINVDHRQVLNAAVVGILADLSVDASFQSRINNITFKSGLKTRTIYIEQIKDDIKTLGQVGFELFEEKTNCGKLLKNITQDEPFLRVYKEGKFLKTVEAGDEQVKLKEYQAPSIDDFKLLENLKNNKQSELPEIKKKAYTAPKVDVEEEEEKEKTVAPKKTSKSKAAKKGEDLDILLLKRDLIRLKKKLNSKIAFAKPQIGLKKTEISNREYEVIGLSNENISLNKEKLDYKKKDLVKQEKDVIRDAIKDSQKAIKEAIKRIQDLNKAFEDKTRKIEKQITLTNETIKNAEEAINNNKIESVSEIRERIKHELKNIGKTYENEVKPEIKSAFNKLRGERRILYSETVRERNEINKNLTDELKEIREKIKKEQDKKQNSQKSSNI